LFLGFDFSVNFGNRVNLKDELAAVNLDAVLAVRNFAVASTRFDAATTCRTALFTLGRTQHGTQISYRTDFIDGLNEVGILLFRLLRGQNITRLVVGTEFIIRTGRFVARIKEAAIALSAGLHTLSRTIRFHNTRSANLGWLFGRVLDVNQCTTGTIEIAFLLIRVHAAAHLGVIEAAQMVLTEIEASTDTRQGSQLSGVTSHLDLIRNRKDSVLICRIAPKDGSVQVRTGFVVVAIDIARLLPCRRRQKAANGGIANVGTLGLALVGRHVFTCKSNSILGFLMAVKAVGVDQQGSSTSSIVRASCFRNVTKVSTFIKAAVESLASITTRLDTFY
jgi:hypothetical protein